MDISSLHNIYSDAIKNAAKTYSADSPVQENGDFGSLFNKALDNLNTTNAYLSDMENEELKWSLGESENTHDLTIALQKASAALQYTVAVRDKFMEAYKEIMQIQI